MGIRLQKNERTCEMSLRRWIRNWLNKDNDGDYPIGALKAEVQPSPHYNNDKTLRFNVTPGNGGIVVAVSGYDKKTGHSQDNLYILPDNEDIGERVSHIVTLEILQR